MRVANRLLLVLGSLSLFSARPAAAQQPRIVNAKIETRSAAAGLSHEFQSFVESHTSPAWLGFAVPILSDRNQICCSNSTSGDWDGSCGHCRLESGNDNFSMHSRDQDSAQAKGPVPLEGGRHLLVLFRIEQKRLDRIRAFSEDCELDAGGLPLTWLTDVRPSESVALLASFVLRPDGEKEDGDRVNNHALKVIALTDVPSAEQALESFVAPAEPEKLRERTSFWLGSVRGKPGLALLERMAKEDPSDRVRLQVTFALSVNSEPQAVDDMIRMAKDDPSSRVRSQALFWIAQKAGKKAAAAISGAIENDPDTGVKRQAVFALTQMPKDEGVPLLIKVAKTNPNPAVRKQAMFWLGQSNDPRALSFFEEVLAH